MESSWRSGGSTSPPQGPTVLCPPAQPQQLAPLMPRTPSTAIPELGDWLAGSSSHWGPDTCAVFAPKEPANSSSANNWAETEEARDSTPDTAHTDTGALGRRAAQGAQRGARTLPPRHTPTPTPGQLAVPGPGHRSQDVPLGCENLPGVLRGKAAALRAALPLISPRPNLRG